MAMSSRAVCSLWCAVVCVISVLAGQAFAGPPADSWEIVVNDAGVSAMHATLMPSNRVVIFDRTNMGKSNITFPDGYCRENPRDQKLKRDCTAHSVAYDIATNSIQCLKVFSDVFCSAGAHRADGTLLQAGGWNDGGNVVRTLGPNPNDDWIEYPNAPDALLSSRWYSSVLILPDDRVIIVGGRRAMSYEFHPRATGEGLFKLPFLRDTNTIGSELNLYPFLFLNTDGNLIIFANQDCILFNYRSNSVVRTYPRIPDGPRNYPASGAAVLLPLSARDKFTRSEIMICGGTPVDAFQNVGKGVFDLALTSCGRMVVTAKDPKWTMLQMPMPRVMGDMVIMPTGELLIINGARNGSAGWRSAKDPVLTPVTFEPARNRFTVWRASTIPRMYHSVALMLPSGKVFVAGGNANPGYSFRNVEFPTELRIELYSPYYLAKKYNARRPNIVEAPKVVTYGSSFVVRFETASKPKGVQFHLYAPSFATHTNSMNQRMLVLASDPVGDPAQGSNVCSTVVYAPPDPVRAPAGYYLLTVLNEGTPSPSVWVQITRTPAQSPAQPLRRASGVA
ncbi:hypothetical protein M758_11G019200 [Ceratodon purpureus]|nr:hypothetical protein M758_11G019200 [Ceratodon purpureus]